MESTELHYKNSTNNIYNHLKYYSSTSNDNALRISPTDIGSMVKQGQSPLYMKLQGDSQTAKKLFKDSDKWVKKLSLSVLSREGNEFEETIYGYLQEYESEGACEIVSSEEYESTEESRKLLLKAISEAQSENPLTGVVRIFKQFPLQSRIGPFSVAGDSDLICVFPTKDGAEIRVFDIKASWEEKTSQQIQTSIYTTLLKKNFDMLSEMNIDISAGIIHKENFKVFDDDFKIDFPSLDQLPEFNVEPREDDAERLLTTDSEMYKYITKHPRDDEGNLIEKPSVDEVAEMLEEIPFQIDTNSENSKFRDVEFRRAIENLDIALLGVTRGTRRAMQENGISTLRELADLTNYDTHTEETVIDKEYEATVRELQREHGVQNIKDLSIRSKAYLQKLIPDDPATDGFKQILPRKEGKRPSTIPNIQYNTFSGKEHITKDRGIKVFLNAQYDYISNAIIQLNAKVKATTEDASDPEYITLLIDDIQTNDPIAKPTNENGRVNLEYVRNKEKDLMRDFTEELFDTIKSVASDHTIQSESIIHFYLYNETEKDRLIEATERHSDARTVKSLRNLLGVRDMGEREQTLWGFIEPEIKECYQLDKLPTFLPAIHSSFARLNRGAGKSDTWDYKYNGSEYNLSNIFRKRFFGYKREYTMDSDGNVSLNNPSKYDTSKDYESKETAVESYSGAQLPLEYFWGCKEFDLLDETLGTDEDESDREVNRSIQKFMYSDMSTKQRMSRKELSAFGLWTVDAIDFVESNMSKESKINKKLFDVRNIDSFSLGGDSLSSSIKDYIDIEHESQKEDLLNEFDKPISSRVKRGKAIPIMVDDIEMGSNGVETIEASLIYNEFDFVNEGFVKASCKHGTGDYMVVTPFRKTDEGTHKEWDGDEYLDGKDLLKSPPCSIKSLDTENNSIELVMQNYYGNGCRYQQKGPTVDPDDFNQPVYKGQKIILDENLSTFMKDMADETMESSESNNTYNLLNNILENGTQIDNTHKFNQKDIDSFISQIEDVDNSNILTPNEKQQELITDLSQISILQGPPGTGKTSGALTTTLLSRIYSTTQWNINGLVTGPSNTAVDELINDVSGLLKGIEKYTNMELDVSLVHLVSKSHNPDYDNEAIEYVNSVEGLGNAEGRKVIERIKDQSTVEQKHTLVFGTPNVIKRLIEKQDHSYESPHRWFDLLVADEASMLTLPKLVMAGAFFDPEGQLIVSGDHRQMSPVQTHEWASETRPNIQKYVPYLSVLNYMRFLRGDSINKIGYPDSVIRSPSVNIPIIQLERTYRCHETVAQFLQNWVYSLDGIDYHSNKTSTLDINNIDTSRGVESVFNDDSMIVITHTDTQSQESNVVEANIAEAVMSEIQDLDIESGVVTPHSSQKGLLKNRGISDEADTVERFQGGERDLIMVSATVSDPAFIRKEDEFLLNPNRVNVAMSRMKQKLIVIVPESVFEHIPSDVDVYNKSIIWNGLYNSVVDVYGSEKWTGSLSEFAGKDVSRGDVGVSVYTK